MLKSLTIVAVRPILDIEKAIVVFEVAGHDAVVRRPKQALTDLRNSGRALNINPAEFERGWSNVSQDTKAKFTSALFDCAGATLTGDLTAIKAGDEYVVTSGHPALTDKNHKFFGKVKEGGKLKAEQDGVWVEGFLSIPLTPAELMRRDVSANIADALLNMYGMGTPAVPVPVAVPIVPENAIGNGAIPPATVQEAFGA